MRICGRVGGLRTFSAFKGLALYILFTLMLTYSGCKYNKSQDGAVSMKRLADSIYQVITANRQVYTQHIVGRLVNQNGLVKVSENWREMKAMPLPAQMLRLGAAQVSAGSNGDIQYGLKSLWAINKANFPAENQEREGLIHILKNPGQNYYQTIEDAGGSYFMAVYPDLAFEEACVQCHNNHALSPKTDFRKGDLMGGIIVRIKI